jgi:hypothetical protein
MKKIEIISACYVQYFTITLTFSSGDNKLVDFLPLFHKHVKGDNLKYFAPQKFKRFIVKNGNIYWGRNEDVIFPVQLLYGLNKKKYKSEEEILFVI